MLHIIKKMFSSKQENAIQEQKSEKETYRENYNKTYDKYDNIQKTAVRTTAITAITALSIPILNNINPEIFQFIIEKSANPEIIVTSLFSLLGASLVSAISVPIIDRLQNNKLNKLQDDYNRQPSFT